MNLVTTIGSADEVLRSIIGTDCDDNGYNGTECNWAVTDEEGFDNNMEYVIAKYSDETDQRSRIVRTLEDWLKHNPNYYYEATYEIEEYDGKFFVAFAYQND